MGIFVEFIWKDGALEVGIKFWGILPAETGMLAP